MDFNQIAMAGVAATIQQAPQNGLPEIVLAGRSNAGKSSLINALCGRRQLARVSQTPGKTRLVVYFELDHQAYLTDLPGYGYAKVSKAVHEQFSELANAYFEANRPIAKVLLLLDIRHEPSVHDQQMMAYLLDKGLPFSIVLAKADKLSRSAALSRRFAFQKAYPLPAEIPVHVISSSSKMGLEALRADLSQSLETYHR